MCLEFLNNSIKYLSSYLMYDGHKERLKLAPNSVDKPLNIFANGPSLLTTITEAKKNSGDILVMNDAYKSDVVKEFIPNFYCVSDPYYFVHIERIYDIYYTMKGVNDQLVYIVPSQWNTDIGCFKKMNLKKVWSYIPKSGRIAGEYSLYALKNNYMCPILRNVTLLAIYAGIQLGYKDIYIYGMDAPNIYNIYVDEHNELFASNSHYYNEDGIEIQATLLRQTMKQYLRETYELYAEYYMLKKYADDLGIRIINMSPKSLVDCYEKFRS